METLSLCFSENLVEELPRMTTLKSVSISRCSVFGFLSKMSNLEELKLPSVRINDPLDLVKSVISTIPINFFVDIKDNKHNSSSVTKLVNLTSYGTTLDRGVQAGYDYSLHFNQKLTNLTKLRMYQIQNRVPILTSQLQHVSIDRCCYTTPFNMQSGFQNITHIYLSARCK